MWTLELFGVRAVTVPFYATSSEAQNLHYMVGDAEIRLYFCR